MMGRKRFVALWLLLAVSCPAFAATETEYLAVFMEGKKIGHAIHTRTEAGGEVTTSDDVTITISRLGIPGDDPDDGNEHRDDGRQAAALREPSSSLGP